MPMFTVLIIIVVFYFNGMRRTVLEFRNAAGLFWADRYKALVESFVNLVVSIPLTYALGVAGVKLGTLISLLGVAFWVEGRILYKYLFQKSVLQYLFLQTKYAVVTGIQLICAYWACRLIDLTSLSMLLKFVLQMVICLIIPNVMIVIIFWKTDEFQYAKNLVKKIIKR